MTLESTLALSVLSTLIIIYLYLLLSPSQPQYSDLPKNFVIEPDTRDNFLKFIADYKGLNDAKHKSYFYMDDYRYNSTTRNNSNSYKEWGHEGTADDFFLDGYGGNDGKYDKKSYEPNKPSSSFRCKRGFVTIRSELNYKYLWMHAGEQMWMGASATIDTPLHRKTFEVIPVNESCVDGWVLLREADSKNYTLMISPTGSFALDEWAVRFGNGSIEEALRDQRYQFLLEEDGYLLNRGSMAFVNVMPEAEYTVRGHTGGWDRTRAATREYGAMMKFQFINSTLVQQAIDKEAKELKEADEQNRKYIAEIASYPTSKEKRVISFGLYGDKDKYTTGAIHNAELAATYFPGWVCRFYVTDDVPEAVISTLKSLGSEIRPVPRGMGYSSGMFWRFLIAADETVDRFIVRDVDSRLNARDRMAVEEWITLKYPVHILRDHVNHCIVMNGGMWGAVKGAVDNMKLEVESWTNRDEYMADLHFLEKRIWPLVKHKQISHDSYCCDRFPNTRPFPTKRPFTYEHVGQVFDARDNPRFVDIDGFIRGVPIPASCRKQSDWIYG